VFEAQRTCCEATSFQAKSANAEWDIERNLTVDPSVACSLPARGGFFSMSAARCRS